MTEGNPNAYCDRLGIDPPVPEELLDSRDLKLFEMVVIVLLENGGPMSVEDLCDRIDASGFDARTWDLRESVLKAWHGSEPVYRDSEGSFRINLSWSGFERFLFRVGLRPSRTVVQLTPIEVVQPGDDVPLSAAELDAAFRDRSLFSLSWRRQAAAILDSANQAMTADEIETAMAGFTRHRGTRPVGKLPQEPGSLLQHDETGLISLNRASSDLRGMRRAVRKLARPVLIQRANSERWRLAHEQAEEQRRIELARLREQAVARRRAILHGAPVPDELEAAVILDVENRSIRTYNREEFSQLRSALVHFQVLAGVHIRNLLQTLGVAPDDWHLVDLKPPQKSRRLNRAGKTLRITPELLISGTTGMSRPLADPNKIAEYIARGERGKLARRLESDANALHAFYRYGALHGCVRLKWGFLDEMLGVDFEMPGEMSLYDILKDAMRSERPVEMVVGTAPGWEQPWSRARRVDVLELSPHFLVVREQGVTQYINRFEIQAIRIAGATEQPWVI